MREGSSCNGYRFAKYEGESIFTNAEKLLQIARFSQFAGQRPAASFTFDSLRCLNCDSNFTDHMVSTSRQTANAYSAELANRFCGIRANKSNSRIEQNTDRSRARRGEESGEPDVSGND
ncbi:MAG: hypothetical protein G4V63_21925 [Candidatus Afipia apatlaquensis]|uniref:Uncharacterized protein n=1 Tax=Candidatus Afipia apatlaquensis TaxID=2712852 RepID=A0A7C9VH98_9BRAD|nr:hypothetical protein [Candidatus Afipia apatlaquensis]